MPASTLEDHYFQEKRLELTLYPQLINLEIL